MKHNREAIQGGMRSYRRVHVKTAAGSQNERISEWTREGKVKLHKYSSQHDASVAVVDEQQRHECEPERISSCTNTHKYKYTTQWSNCSRGRMVIRSALTGCRSAIVPFPPFLVDVSRLPVIIGGGASPVGCSQIRPAGGAGGRGLGSDTSV